MTCGVFQVSGSGVSHCDTGPDWIISVSQLYGIVIVSSETGSAFGEDFMSMEVFVEETGSLGDAEIDHQTEGSAVYSNFLDARPLPSPWSGIVFFPTK